MAMLGDVRAAGGAPSYDGGVPLREEAAPVPRRRDRVRIDPLFNPQHRYELVKASAAVGCAALSLAVPISAIQIIGATVLAGVKMKMFDNATTCYLTPEYFRHVYDKDGDRIGRKDCNRLIHTRSQAFNNTVSAVGWSMINTWKIAAIVGVAFAIIAQFPLMGSAVAISATQLTPFLSMGSVVALVISHTARYFSEPEDPQEVMKASRNKNMITNFASGVISTLIATSMYTARAGLFVH